MTLTTYERIREAVRAIPKGTVRTHSEIASELGTTPMHVGKAIWSRDAYTSLPWWRVIPKNGLGIEYHHESDWFLGQIAILLGEGVKLRVHVQTSNIGRRPPNRT